MLTLDPANPDISLQRISDLRSRKQTRDAALLALIPRDMPQMAAMALDLGVDDLIEAPFEAEEVALRIRRELARKAQAAARARLWKRD